VQDLGYGTVRKRNHGGVSRTSQLSADSASPTAGQVHYGLCLCYFTLFGPQEPQIGPDQFSGQML